MTMITMSALTNKILKFSLLILSIAVVLASIKPLYWQSYVLHQLGTLIFMAITIILAKKSIISHIGIVGMTLFLLLHILGARYLYSYVPYDDWSKYLFNISISETFNFKRNHYDRLVHFGYGLFLYPLIYEICQHYFYQNTKRQLIMIALLINLASSAIYELFEWFLAIGLSPKQAEQYNGQQGDMWDAHKDMALALIGAIMSSCCYAKIPKS